MRKDQRKERRYKEAGKVECTFICALPGVIENVSNSGLNARFPNPAVIYDDMEYTLHITLSSSSVPRPLDLICLPVWKSKGDNETVVGFKVLRSPDSPLWSDFIKRHEEKAKEDSSSSAIPFDHNINFVE